MPLNEFVQDDDPWLPEQLYPLNVFVHEVDPPLPEQLTPLKVLVHEVDPPLPEQLYPLKVLVQEVLPAKATGDITTSLLIFIVIIPTNMLLRKKVLVKK